MKTLFIDTERDDKHHIIQLGAAIFNEKGEVIDTFCELIKTNNSISFHITNLTGINTNSLKNARTPKEVTDSFNEFVLSHNDSDKPLTAFSWGSDAKFIHAHYSRLGYSKDEIPIAPENFQKNTCLALTKKKNSILSLTDAANTLGVKFVDPHNALGDAICAGQVYFALKNPTSYRFISLKTIDKMTPTVNLFNRKDVITCLVNCENIIRKKLMANKDSSASIDDLSFSLDEISFLVSKYMNKETAQKDKFPILSELIGLRNGIIDYSKINNGFLISCFELIDMHNDLTQELNERTGDKLLLDTPYNREFLSTLSFANKIQTELNSSFALCFGEKEKNILMDNFKELDSVFTHFEV